MTFAFKLPLHLEIAQIIVTNQLCYNMLNYLKNLFRSSLIHDIPDVIHFSISVNPFVTKVDETAKNISDRACGKKQSLDWDISRGQTKQFCILRTNQFMFQPMIGIIHLFQMTDPAFLLTQVWHQKA